MTEQTECIECGMLVDPLEYHPYAACLMFKACRDGSVVRANLDAVRANGAQWERDFMERTTESETADKGNAECDCGLIDLPQEKDGICPQCGKARTTESETADKGNV